MESKSEQVGDVFDPSVKMPASGVTVLTLLSWVFFYFQFLNNIGPEREN